MRIFILTTALVLAALSSSAQQADDVIIPVAAASRVIVPVAGSAAGQNGTFFRSDLNLINLSDTPQRVQIFWMPQGVPGSNVTPIRTVDVPARSGFGSEDFVAEILGTSGVGAIEFIGINQDGTLDNGALLHVTQRIWTPRPDGAAGTMSQTFPAIVGGGTTPANVKSIFGMRRSAQFRLNVGMTNPSSSTQRFRITVAVTGQSGTETSSMEIDVPQRSMHQVTAPGSAFGTAQVLVEDIGGGAGDWHAWASSIDNASGDAWSQIAVGGN